MTSGGYHWIPVQTCSHEDIPTHPLHCSWHLVVVTEAGGKHPGMLSCIFQTFITARKRSLRRLCFYMCPSFCPPGGEYLAGTPPTRYTHRNQVQPLGPGTPPGPGTSTGTYIPPSYHVQPPRWVHHPRAVHDGRYVQQAGGTHPTGINSCFSKNLSIYIIFEMANLFHVHFVSEVS